MKQEQVILCEKHRPLLQFIWSWGWGCALQPLLVDSSVWFRWYASPQMCRRGIRELKKGGLLKSKTWVDGKSEILILTKPAIAFVSGKETKEISSYPKHATRDSELLSICRMMYVLQYARMKSNHSYDSVNERFINGISTICRRIGDLLPYWFHSSFFRQFRKEHVFQANRLQTSLLERRQLHLDEGERKPLEKPLFPVLTIESLHRRGISIVGHSAKGTSYLFHFCVFNIHDLNAKRVMDYYVLCNDWVKSFNFDLEARLTVYCMDPSQKKHLASSLLKPTHGRPYWEHTLATKADTTKGIPVVVQNLGLKGKYM